jgi:hypothetical protein
LRFLNFSHPPITPTAPHRPTHLCIKIKNRVFPIYLLTYKFKICYSHSHPHTHPVSIFLPTNTLGRYLPNPSYMVTPIYLVETPIDPQRSKTMRKKWNEGIACNLVLFIEAKFIRVRLK